MSKKRVKKIGGFTLIELLAVITILAVLILAAMPAVTGLMNRAIKGSFRSEVLGMAQSGIQSVYSTKIMNETASDPIIAKVNCQHSSDICGYNRINDNTVIPIYCNESCDTLKLFSGSGTIYKKDNADYLCMGLDDLVNQNYIQKSDYQNYGGYFQIKVERDGTTTIAINITNGKYYIKTTYKKLSAAGDVSDLVLNSKPVDGAEINRFDCPNDGTMAATD